MGGITMNKVEIKFDKDKNVYLRVNHGEWIIKHWEDLTEYERILMRSLQPESGVEIVSEKIPFEE